MSTSYGLNRYLQDSPKMLSFWHNFWTLNVAQGDINWDYWWLAIHSYPKTALAIQAYTNQSIFSPPPYYDGPTWWNAIDPTQPQPTIEAGSSPFLLGVKAWWSVTAYYELPTIRDRFIPKQSYWTGAIKHRRNTVGP
jgi:hypothetical protein